MILSIIIPIYKAEPYIERCARSLMEQTMEDGIEFIFINDCTPDASMEILGSVLSDYPQRKGQVRIINNEINKGVSATRLIGIEAAKGEYIGWCDSDDWVEPTMYQKMYDATQNGVIDVVVANFIEELSDKAIKRTYNKCCIPQECIEKSWQGYYFPGSLWQQISRKGIILNSMSCISHVDYGEDLYSLWLTYYRATSIAYVEDYLYHYNCLNLSSLVHNVDCSKGKWAAHKANLNMIKNILFENGGEKRYHIAINAFKFAMLNKYKKSFRNILDFYYELPECFKDVNDFLFTPQKPVINRIKTYLVYNVFALFWLYHHKEF